MLRLWQIGDERKQSELLESDENNRDFPSILEISSLFGQSILIIGQVFNTAHPIKEKNILKTAIDEKNS